MSLVYKRGKNWYAKATRRSLETSDKGRAEWLAAKQATEAWDRKHRGVSPELTWDEACLTWIDEVGKYLKSSKNQGYVCGVLTQYFTGMYLSEITRDVMHKIMLPRVTDEPSARNGTTNQYVDFASKIIKHGGLVSPKFVRYPTLGGRDRWLTVDEWFTISPEMNLDFLQLCTFALATGIREANVMFFRTPWDKGDVMEIPPEFTKTEKTYYLPINRTARAILDARKALPKSIEVFNIEGEPVRSCELAFLRSNGKPWYRVAVSRAMKAAVEAAGIEPIVFHGLRHTFASWLAAKGVPMETIERLGCWKSRGMVNRYAHLSVENLRKHSQIIDTLLTQTAERLSQVAV